VTFIWHFMMVGEDSSRGSPELSLGSMDRQKLGWQGRSGSFQMTFHARLLPPGSVAPESHIMRGRPRQIKPHNFHAGFCAFDKKESA
jgi:hypothetical protein